jgi:hypothetical protein
MSDEQVMDLAEVKGEPIKHLGLFRSVVENGVSRNITIAECRLAGLVLTTVWRRDNSHGGREGMPEGTLASWVKCKIGDAEFQACITRLLDWKMIRVIPAYFGDSRRIGLTDPGTHWAVELITARQRVKE